MIYFLEIMALVFIIFMFGWAVGFKEGREEQKEILVKLRRQINANNQG